MLQALRNQASSWVVKILLGFLIVSFAIWGVNDIFLGERDPAVAKVGGVKIPRSQVDQEIRDQMNRLQPLFGDQIQRDKTLRMRVASQVVQNMINRTALSVGAHDLGIVVSDQAAAHVIQTDPSFQNSKGQFDRNTFNRALAQAGMTETYYVATLKRRLMTRDIDSAATEEIPLPSTLVDPMVRFRSETRMARTVLVPDPKLGSIGDPTPKELKKYYDAHKSRFTAPVMRDVTYVDLDPQAMAKNIGISNDRLHKAYQDRINEFTVAPRRQVEQVVFKTEAAAKQAAKEIAAGKSLAEAAKSVDPSLKPVSLGWVEKSDLFKELAGPVFALDKPGTTAPIKTTLGWHIVRVENIEKGSRKPFDAVKAQLRHDLAARQAQDQIYTLTQKLEDTLASGTPVAEAATKLGLPSRHIPAIDAEGRGPDGKAVTGLPKGVFVRTAFETDEGEDSDLIDTQDGGYFLLHVNHVIPSKLRPLKDVKAEATAAWKEEQRSKAAAKRAKAILERLKKGDKLADVAKAENLKVETTPPITRMTHDADSGVPAALTDKLFKIKKGEATMAPAPNGTMVAVLQDIREPTDKEKAKVKAKVEDELRDGIAADLFQQMVAAFRARVSVETNMSLLQESGS